MIPTEAEAFQNVSEPATADVFICYARSDYQFVQRLEDGLEKNGKSVWVDEPDTVSSDEWQQIIQAQIEASQSILVVLSPDFVTSRYNEQELTYAASLNKRLIPILYREGFTLYELHPEIAKIQWLHFRESDDFDRTFLELLKILNADFDTFTLQAKTEDTSETGKNTPVGFEGHEYSVLSVAFAPDGTRIVSGSLDKTIRLWDLQGNAIGQPFQGHEYSVKSVAFSPDGTRIVSGSDDKTIRLWTISYKTQITFVSQKIQNDLAKGRDCLNIEHEIHALADILAMRDVEPPLAVGILGGWGSGKSFAMHLIQRRLNEIRSRKLIWNQAWIDKKNPYVGHIYQIQFDAWTYAKADLWASLMQTIFYEFNRQLALEKQIAEALVQSKSKSKPPEKKNTLQSLRLRILGQQSLEDTPSSSPSTWDLQQAQLEGGDFWQALNEMSEGDRAIILQSRLTPEAFDQLKQSKSQQEFTDYLWKQIGSLRQGEKQVLNDKADILKKEKKDLRFLLVRRAPIYFLQKNWLFVVAFLVGASITVYPLLPKGIQDRFPQNLQPLLATFPTTIVGAVSAILTGKSLFDKTREEQEKVLEIWKKQQETLQNQAQSAREFGTSAYQELLQSDPKVQQKLNDIQQLETQISLQQQKLGLSSTVPSLNAFISERLQTDSYAKQLGTLQQVQRDLADLTQHFTFPSQADITKDEFKEKLAKIKEIFPRGSARIVLYIDDLDRCPPDQVVKVLEAVQLILKTPLFIVVLAIDDRYIARSLEKVYEGVLTRQGHPSGIDYLEKIIQLPYRMRPIGPEGLEGYLKSQIDLEEVQENISNQNDSRLVQQTQITTEVESDFKNMAESFNSEFVSDAEGEAIPANTDSPQKTSSEPSTETILTENISQITKFTQEEFRLIQDCCKHVDISPRTAKRLINIFKILKIVWSNTSEPNPDIKQAIIAFLALSGRYPDFMRFAFNEIDTCFEKADDVEGDRTLVEILNPAQPPLSNNDKYAQREWTRFQHDIQQMIPNTLTLNEMGRSTFNLILSFCFVGDIGYDPQDFSALPA